MQNSASTLKPMFSPCVHQPFTAALMTLFRVPFDDTIGVIDSPVEMIASMNGDPTPLRFGNVDAELFGVDLDFLLRPVKRIELSGTASFVRGKRRDVDDDLYRIPPANL